MGVAFASPLDIVNRAAQHCGVSRVFALNSANKQAQELAFAYDKIRAAEGQRNVWRYGCRRTWLWPVDVTSLRLVPPAWATGTTYKAGDVVSAADPLTQLVRYWVSRVDANTGNIPSALTIGVGVGPAGLAWDSYFGSLYVEAFNVLQGTVQAAGTVVYGIGDLVYQGGSSPGSYTIYRSLIDGNTNTPNVVDAWNGNTMYGAGAVVAFNGTNYQSLAALNFNNEPDTSPTWWTLTVTNPLVSASWSQLTGATGTVPRITYPVGTGPSSQTTTRNLYGLPCGWLRKAPQAPAVGRISWLGGPVGNVYNDWEYTDGYIVSALATPITYRFVADVLDVSLMDDMFCEGLGAKLALNAGALLTDKEIDRKQIEAAFALAMRDARLNNAIEEGADDPPEDEWITVRL